jgi:hypothetical protein
MFFLIAIMKIAMDIIVCFMTKNLLENVNHIEKHNKSKSHQQFIKL